MQTEEKELLLRNGMVKTDSIEFLLQNTERCHKFCYRQHGWTDRFLCKLVNYEKLKLSESGLTVTLSSVRVSGSRQMGKWRLGKHCPF